MNKGLGGFCMRAVHVLLCQLNYSTFKLKIGIRHRKEPAGGNTHGGTAACAKEGSDSHRRSLPGLAGGQYGIPLHTRALRAVKGCARPPRRAAWGRRDSLHSAGCPPVPAVPVQLSGLRAAQPGALSALSRPRAREAERRASARRRGTGFPQPRVPPPRCRHAGR